MFRLRTLILAVFLVVALSFGAWYAPQALNPVPPSKEKKQEDRAWVSSSPYWLDRQACRFMGLCGIHHLRSDPPFLNSDEPAPVSEDAPEDSHRSLELRSLPVLDDLDREAAWEVLPPPRSQQKLGTNKPPKNKPAPKKPASGSKPETLQSIPKYVLDYAPLVHLCSEEYFWPADIAEHVQHVTPHVEHPVEDDPTRLNLTEQLSLHNIQDLLGDYASSIYLVSDNDVEHRPEWLYSNIGVPVPSDDDDYDGDGDGDGDGRYPSDQPWEDEARDDAQRLTPPTSWFDVDKDRPLHRISDPRRLDQQPDRGTNRGPKRRHHNPLQARHNKPDEEGYSKAPAVLILVDKGSGIVDAFWFFFYSYNLGQTVLGIRFGNHVGDWEHAMVRFEHGVPRGIFFSEHEGGQAYAWEAVEKRGGRPVIYSAVGSHAMYAMPGVQAYILPFKLLKDVTDKGPIWDPAKNIYAYHYDDVLDESTDPEERARSLVPTDENPLAPTGWFYYEGSWGDKVYSLADPRQWRLFGQYHYVTGPSGPRVKSLARRKMCQNDRCTILRSLVPGTTWYG